MCRTLTDRGIFYQIDLPTVVEAGVTLSGQSLPKMQSDN